MNIFYLAGYPAAAVATAFVMRRLHISHLASLAIAILFTMLPYHYMRGESHLFLSMYWIIPLLLLVAVWLDSAKPPFLAQGSGGRLPLALEEPRTLAALAICAAAGACGVYHMFFGCFFLAMVGLRAALRDRTIRPLVVAFALVAVSAVVFFAQMLPSVVYSARHGKNQVVAARTPYEAEIYGLRITQMLLPIDNHRVSSMANKRAAYRAMSHDGNNEANVAALGVVGSLGFLLSLSVVLLGWPRCRTQRAGTPAADDPVGLRLLGFLTLCGVLLGTVSGFGAVFAGAVTPQIRAYNRISVFIALFAFATLGVLADRLLRARQGARWRVPVGVGICLVVAVGVLDQTPTDLAGGRDVADKEYSADAAFGKQVETRLPSGASVFQLPYLAYPESPPKYGMQDYDPFRGYVHTLGLRWSYGAVKGRKIAAWQESTAALPPRAMVRRLRLRGFAAIWVQLNGYEDGGAAIKAELGPLLGPPVAVHRDGAFVLWRL
jgi:phosphoglycerol transferase